MLRADNTPDSYWVQVGDSELRRNRKHLFLYSPDDLEIPLVVNDEELIEHDEISDLDEDANYETANDGQDVETDLSDIETTKRTTPQGVVTRSGRASRPRKFDDMVYY